MNLSITLSFNDIYNLINDDKSEENVVKLYNQLSTLDEIENLDKVCQMVIGQDKFVTGIIRRNHELVKEMTPLKLLRHFGMRGYNDISSDEKITQFIVNRIESSDDLLLHRSDYDLLSKPGVPKDLLVVAYEKTQDERLLPQEAKDIFQF